MIRNKELIKNLLDDELNCYVCRKKITKLGSLRTAYNNKKADLLSDRILALREYVSRRLMFICTRKDSAKIVRHSACNPLNYKPSVEEL